MERMTDTSSNDRRSPQSLPDEWPEMYSAAGESPSCPHQMHWDSSDAVYRCIHGCGKTADQPPAEEIENR